jgi:hypothetical protein
VHHVGTAFGISGLRKGGEAVDKLAYTSIAEYMRSIR